MTSIIAPITAAGLGIITLQPMTDVEPFSLRTAASYESILSTIRVWLRDELVPYLNDHGAEAVFQQNVDMMIDAVNDALGAQATTVTAALNAAVQEVVTASIPVTTAVFETMGMHVAPAPTGGDDTTALNAWLSGLTGVGSLRSVTYRTSAPLVVPAGVTVLAQGAKLFGISGSFDMVTLSTGAKIIGLEVDGNRTVRTGGRGIVANTPTYTQIVDCFVHDTNGLGIQVSGTGGGWLVRNNRVVNAGGQGIYITASRGRTLGNHVDGAQHGIQWWGGDSAVSTTIGVSHLVIANNTISNVTGGVWGSLGQFITVDGNDIENCSDVGIDFEGCQDCTATGGTVHNAKNACLAVFFGSKRVKFSGITVLNDADNAAGGNGAGFKAFSGQTSTNITVENCEMLTVNAAVQTDTAALDASVINGNLITVTQTIANGKAVRILDCPQVDVINNRISCHTSTGISFEGPSDSSVFNNRIITDADGSAVGSVNGGILLYARSGTYPTKRNRVKNNAITGFVQSINDHYGITADPNTFNLIESNIAASINHSSVGGTYGGLITNNRKSDLSASTLTTV